MRSLALLSMAFALVVAACTDSPDAAPVIEVPTTEALVEEDFVVATVNGSEIPMSRVQPLHPFRPDAVPAEFMATILRDVIIQEIVVQAATAEFGVTRDEAQVEAKFEEIKQGIEQSQGSYESYLVAENRTDHAMRELAFQSVVRDQIEEVMARDLPDLTPEELQAQYELQLPALTQLCISRIIVETEAEALAALDRLNAGEEFAAVAADVSVEQGAAEAGGYIGCVPPTGFPDVFSEVALAAPLGVPGGPVETQFGYHVFLVDSRFIPTLEEATPLIEAGRMTQVDLRFSQWVNDLIGSAEVVVAPEFGTWTLLPVPGVQPPAG